MTETVVVTEHNVVTPVSVDAEGNALRDSSDNPVSLAAPAGTMPGTFLGGALVNPAADERPAVQFWNPSASGVNAIIEDIYISNVGADETFGVYLSSAALTTEEASYSTQAMHPDETQTAQGEVRTDIDNAGAGTLWFPIRIESSAQPFQITSLIGKVFAPATGVSLYGQTNDGTVLFHVVWREVAV